MATIEELEARIIVLEEQVADLQAKDIELEDKNKDTDDLAKETDQLAKKNEQDIDKVLKEIFPKSPKIVEDEGDEFEEVSRPPKKKDFSRA